MPLTPSEVDQQTIHVMPKYGIQIRCKTSENCSSLEVKIFLLFLALTPRKFGKNFGFSKVNIFFDKSSHQFQKKATPPLQPPQNPAYAKVSKLLKST